MMWMSNGILNGENICKLSGKRSLDLLNLNVKTYITVL